MGFTPRAQLYMLVYASEITPYVVVRREADQVRIRYLTMCVITARISIIVCGARGA